MTAEATASYVIAISLLASGLRKGRCLTGTISFNEGQFPVAWAPGTNSRPGPGRPLHHLKLHKRIRKLEDNMGMVRKTMDADTLSALCHLITKWEMIIAGAGGDDGGLNCALCRKFFDHPNFCEGCPVKTRTRLKGCSGSPYDDWACHHEREHSDGDDCCPLTIECGECHRLAETQLDFLRGLLPREHATGGSPAAALFHWWIKRGSEIILDFLHGVDTAPGASSGERAHAGIRGAHAYDPAPWWTLKRSMRLASIRAEGFTFVESAAARGESCCQLLLFRFRVLSE